MEMIPPPAPIRFVKKERSMQVCEAEVQVGEAVYV
jgi:hypothetical protein